MASAPATEEILTRFTADISDLEQGVAKATATLRKYEDVSGGAAASGNDLTTSLGSIAAKTATLATVQQKYIQTAQQAGAATVKSAREATSALDIEAKKVEMLTTKVNELRTAQGQKINQPGTPAAATAPTTPTRPVAAATPAAAPTTTVQSNIPALHQEALDLIQALEGVDTKQKEILSTLVTITGEYERLKVTGEEFPGQFEQLRAKATDALGAMTGLSAEQVKVEIEAMKAEEAFEGQNKALDKTPKKFVSIQQQIRKAKAEAGALIQEFGQFDPRSIAAVKRVSQLEEEFSDLNDTVKAFSPEQKFRVVAQLGQNLAGGLTAAQGALTALGVGGDQAAEALAKVQGLLAVTQGLDAFAGIGDSLKNFIALLRSSTVVQNVATAAAERDVAVKGAQTGAIVAETTATNAANVATKSWTASLLTNPFVLAAAAIAAIVVAVVAFSDEVEEATETYDEFAKSVNQDLEADKQFAKLRNSIVAINQEILEVRGGTADTKEAIGRRNEIIQAGFKSEIQLTENAIDEIQQKRDQLLDQLKGTEAGEGEEIQRLADEVTKANEEIASKQREVIDLGDAATIAEQRGFLELEQLKAKTRDDSIKKAQAAAKEEEQIRKNLNKKLLEAEEQFRIASLPKEQQQIEQAKKPFDSLEEDAKQIKNAEVRSAALKRIEEDREKAVSLVLTEQLKERQKQQDDYLKGIEAANLSLKENAIVIEEARWEGVIAAAEIAGEERIAQARKNNEDISAVELEVVSGLGDLRIQKEKSLLNARLALIDLEGEERKNKLIEQAEAEFAIADAAGISTLERQAQLGEQLVQIDQQTAQARIDAMATVDQASAELAQQEADRRLSDAQKEQAVQQERLQTVSNFFGAVSQLAEEQSAEQKALQTVQALINTYAGVAAVLGNPETVGPPPVDLAFRILSAATIVANGIAAVRKIQGAYHGEEFVGATGRPDRPGRDGYLRWTHHGERIVTAEDNREHYGMLSAMHRGKLQEFIDANYVIPAINRYLSSDEGQRVSHSIMLPPFQDGNIVRELSAGRKEAKRTNELLYAIIKHQPKRVRENRRTWN